MSKEFELKIEKKSLLKKDEAVCRRRLSAKKIKHKETYRLIDLFAGAGGMTVGFSKKWFNQPFEAVWANDFNEYCIESYNANFGKHCVPGDIVSILEDPEGMVAEFGKGYDFRIPEADVVIGGPPCQGFSLLNKNREQDQRHELWRPFLQIVKQSKADIFVMENVPQLLGKVGTFEYGEIVGMAESIGFKVTQGKLCAADYGVPQVRYRAFVIGCKFMHPSSLFPPRRTHYDPNNNGRRGRQKTLDTNNTMLPDSKPWLTVRDAIGDLPEPVGTEIREEEPPLDLHFGRTPTEMSKKRYRAIPKEGMNRFDLLRNAPELTPQCWVKKKSGGTDLFGRLWWKKPAFTIRTEFFKPEKGRYLHPKSHRPITHREAARVQGFPDDFIFRGSKIEIAKQIGNAVPPPLAARIADIVGVMLAHRPSKKTRKKK